MNNLVSIVTETKLKDRVQPWIANKFDGVRVFVSGLDSGYLGSGVMIIINNTLAKHVYKVVEVPRQLLSVKLLFRNKLSVSILDLYVGASVSAQFLQVDEINFLIAKAVNESSFMILGSDFNEDGSHRCASFRKCFDLGLVNTNSRGVAKVIDYVFMSSSLVNTILDRSVTRVDEYFDTDHRAVAVSVGLGGLLDINLMSLHKQVNKDQWKFNFKDAMAAKWAAFKESSTVTAAMFKCEFDAALLFLDLDAMWDIIRKIVCLSASNIFKKKWFKGYDNVFTKESSKFHKLELLVSKLVKTLCLVSSEEFVALLSMWNLLDTTNASVVESLFLSGSHFKVIRSVLFRVRKLYYSSKLSELKHAKESRIRSAVSRRMESFEVDKGHTIRSVLEHPFHKVVLDHLVVNDELVLDPSLVKSKMDVIMEDWTRKCELVANVSADWCRQYQPLEYIFNKAFSKIMDPISSVKLLGVVSDLPNNKAAGLSGISNELWKHYNELVLDMLLMLLNSCLLRESILSKIFSDRISLAYSTHNVLRGDNFSVLKGTTTQSPIFAVGSVVEDALEKNCELWLVLQNIKKAYDSVGWEHLKRSLIRIKMLMTDFGLTDGYQVHDSLDQREVFSSLLWHIFYDSLLCEVKRQEEFCGYRLNSHFIAKTGHVEPQAGFSSFFVAGAFVDDTIWVSCSQTATQHILNVASEFFRINDISINNDKTVAIPINCRVVSPFLTISGSPISIVKKEEPHRYLGIFLFTDGLSKPSLAKTHLDVQFFTNLVLKKAISDKQFLYLVLAVLQPIVSYRTQFSFVPLSVCCKWNALICKGFKSKAGLPLDFPNDALYHPFLYGLKTFEQIQAESKLASIVYFANAVGILGQLFFYRSHDLQTLSWCPVHSLVSPVWFIFLPTAAYPLVVPAPVHSDSSYKIAFVEQLRQCNGGVFDWKTFKCWKRLDPHGPISDWFGVSVGYLGGVGSSSSVHGCSVSISSASSVLESTDFDLVHNRLLGLGADSLLVYTDGSLAGLGTLSVKSGVVVFFNNINMGLGVKVSGLLSSTLVELQAIALALECVPTVSKVSLFSDSQAALDTCRSELGFVHPNFWNSCWVEHHHIAGFVHVKRLDVSWCKIKRHSGVVGNDQADDLAGRAALSDFVLPPQLDEQFILAGSSLSIHHSHWGFSSGNRVVTGKLFTNIDWCRSSFVWHPNSHMAAGFTTLHHRLPVAVCKCLYDRSYSSVVCLFCGSVEVSDHVFSCDSDFANCDRLLVCVALCKGFVFNNWFFKAVSVFGDLKLAGAKIVDFVCNFCLAFRDEVWLVRVKHHAFMEKHGLIPRDSSVPVSISGLSSLYSAGVVRLLGIDNAFGIRFGLRKFSLFVSGTLNAVSVHIGA
ncbi:hypothetical protein G9A89_018324 [Geosiphon pyriformis]|nr:hypothetical protein G9A89_018324 [Geosiphon pyriformis]